MTPRQTAEEIAEAVFPAGNQQSEFDALADAIEKALHDQIEACWQPIETAPKDGTPILAHCQPCCVETGRPMPFNYARIVWWRREKFKDSKWPWRAHHNDSAVEPTHWMPLPTPPGASAIRALKGKKP